VVSSWVRWYIFRLRGGGGADRPDYATAKRSEFHLRTIGFVCAAIHPDCIDALVVRSPVCPAAKRSESHFRTSCMRHMTRVTQWVCSCNSGVVFRQTIGFVRAISYSDCVEARTVTARCLAAKHNQSHFRTSCMRHMTRVTQWICSCNSGVVFCQTIGFVRAISYSDCVEARTVTTPCLAAKHNQSHFRTPCMRHVTRVTQWVCSCDSGVVLRQTIGLVRAISHSACA
jgi:hypothetical protein